MFNHCVSVWKERIRSSLENQYFMFAGVVKLFLRTNISESSILIEKIIIIIQYYSLDFDHRFIPQYV
jgi:hypothetical protein